MKQSRKMGQSELFQLCLMASKFMETWEGIGLSYYFGDKKSVMDIPKERFQKLSYLAQDTISSIMVKCTQAIGPDCIISMTLKDLWIIIDHQLISCLLRHNVPSLKMCFGDFYFSTARTQEHFAMLLLQNSGCRSKLYYVGDLGKTSRGDTHITSQAEGKCEMLKEPFTHAFFPNLNLL